MTCPPHHGNNLEDLSEEEAQEAHDRLEQQTFLARFGAPNPPPIVTSTTVLPPTPIISDCGDRRPKLTILQLITLAIVEHADRSPTGQELLQWIEGRFVYFTWNAVALANVKAKLQDFFFEYDPPVVPLSEKYQHVAMPWEAGDLLNLRYAIVVGHLNILFPDRLTSFHFMALPAELRLHVYEYALAMPCEQLTRAWHVKKNGKIQIHSMVHYDEDRNEGWSGNTYFRCPRVRIVLGLLSVSRKVREEALPIFYRINTFLYDTNSFDRVLTGMGAARRNFIRSITIDYHPRDYLCSENNFGEILADFKELESLTLWIARPYVLSDGHRAEYYRKWGTLRGIKKFRVHGRAKPEEIERVRAYLEPLVTQPRDHSGEIASEEPDQKRLKMAAE